MSLHDSNISKLNRGTICQKKAQEFTWNAYAQKIIDFNFFPQRLHKLIRECYETIPLSKSLSSQMHFTDETASEYKLIKNVIWIYFILLLFEGALRKWFLPLSQGLLIIRDPIVIWIYYLTVKKECSR